MSEPFLDPFDKYQYLAFKVVLFVIFLVTALEVLDKHIGLKRHAKQLFKWLLSKMAKRRIS